MSMEERFLIVGLGNPGQKYEDTRHNVGFRVVKVLAAKYCIPLKPALIRAKGSLGDGSIHEKRVNLLLPLTYMNESGLSVKKCASYYKIPVNKLIVVTDDAALPFGQLRIRARGTCGGHNGLRSIEAHLGGQEYTRLRIGVGAKQTQELADHVLGKFSQEELRQMPAVVDRAIEALEIWLRDGVEAASAKANRAGE